MPDTPERHAERVRIDDGAIRRGRALWHESAPPDLRDAYDAPAWED